MDKLFWKRKKNIAYDLLYKDAYKDKKILYEGEYRNGKFHGQGTITYPDGIKYVGEWKDAKLHGFGTYTFPNGRVLKGIWKKSELVEQHEMKKLSLYVFLVSKDLKLGRLYIKLFKHIKT